jgi:hypothetical protein
VVDHHLAGLMVHRRPRQPQHVSLAEAEDQHEDDRGGTRRFYGWTLQGKQVRTWDNPSFFTDYQDCQYVPSAKMICGGITNLPQTPAAGGSNATYELGGLTMIDLRSHNILREVPFQKWSTAGHVMTRNPVKMSATGNQLTLWAAPDNGNEGNGTELFTYQANVTR